MKTKLVIALISLFVAIAIFTLNARWVAAESATTLDQSSRDRLGVNPGWKSYVIEHGKVIEWRLGTVKDNPFLFGVSVVGNIVFLAPFLVMLWRWKSGKP